LIVQLAESVNRPAGKGQALLPHSLTRRIVVRFPLA
jgi:hypothetical protein